MITSDIIKTLLNLYGNVVNDVSNDSNEKLIQLLEEQLAQSNKRNEELLKQIESLSQQVRYLIKLLYGSKSEKSKYQAPDGQCSLFDDDSFFNEPEYLNAIVLLVSALAMAKENKGKKAA
ncbi:hypothetical protein [Ureibacillus thermophilus]|uniref:IS66 family transposase n=1 Tax=Ureibacillus thermophilus TaxID=367743 RepID=UPI001C9DB86A|nr:hypothetical protein [Ureibacillus thermophilus]